jgi:hypothetical protein
MVAITRLQVVHAICVNLVEDTSIDDPRMAAIMGARDGIAEAITELEQPKDL